MLRSRRARDRGAHAGHPKNKAQRRCERLWRLQPWIAELAEPLPIRTEQRAHRSCLETPDAVCEGPFRDHTHPPPDRPWHELSNGFLIGDIDRTLDRIKASTGHRVPGRLALPAVADIANLARLARPLENLDDGALPQRGLGAGVQLHELDSVRPESHETLGDTPLEHARLPIA